MTNKGWIELPLKKMVKAVWNYKKEDEEKSKKLLANVKRNGQIENLIVRELDSGFFEVVNGNHRYDTFTELQFEKAMVFNFGKISQQAAERIAIETNETRFETDTLKLAELVKDISTEFDLADLETTMPFTDEELTNFTKLTDFDFDAYNAEVKVTGSGTDTDDWKTVQFRLPLAVAEQLENQVDRFKQALHPEEELSDISPVQAIEAMVQHLAQLDDEDLIG